MAIGIIPNYILYLSMIIQEIIALLWLEYIYILLFYLNISFTTPTFRTHGIVLSQYFFHNTHFSHPWCGGDT